MIEKYIGNENAKPNIIKVLIYLIILIAAVVIGYMQLGFLSIIAMAIFFGIAMIPQFPSNRLVDEDDNSTGSGSGGSFGGGSFGGGSSGGGGSFGGGGSSRGF